MSVKYLANGQEVEIVEKTSRGILVNKLYYTGEDEYIDDMPIFVNKVFDKPPTEKIAESINKLLSEKKELTQQISHLNEKLTAEEEHYKAREKKFDQYEALQTIDDFLENKITHVVYTRDYEKKILTLNELKSKYGEDTLRLIGLSGKILNGWHENTIEWHVNQYSDGSGSNSPIIPCTSYEQALAVLINIINKGVKSYGITARTLRLAAEYKFELEPEDMKKYLEKKIGDTEKEILSCGNAINKFSDKIASYRNDINNL